MKIAPFDIIYQDEHIIAICKPGGILVHRSKESRDKVFVLQTLAEQIGQYIYPVHRLDRAASGVMVFALSSEDARLLQENLGSSETRKEYIALVRGISEEEWEMDRPLKNENGEKQNARTEFKKIADFFRCSLLRARIHTGRRHQIRRHLSHHAHQIIGDTTHGKGKINRFFREEYGLPRLFLHARWLDVRHPRSQEMLHLESPLSSDLREFLLRLPEFPTSLIDSL